MPACDSQRQPLQEGPLRTEDPGDGMRVFLNQIAVAALEGRFIARDELASHEIAVPLPLHARESLLRLRILDRIESIVSELKLAIQRPATVSAWTRIGVIIGCCLPLAIIPFGELGELAGSWQFERTYPEFVQLNRCLNRLMHLDQASETTGGPDERHALEVYVMSLFKPYSIPIFDPATRKRDDGPYFLNTVNGFKGDWPHKIGDRRIQFSDRREELLKRLDLLHYPSEPEIALAKEKLKPLLNPSRSSLSAIVRHGVFAAVQYLFSHSEMPALLIAAPSLLAALAFRSGLFFRLLRVAIVCRNGTLAPRWRVFLRALVTWLPILTLAIVCHSANHDLHSLSTPLAISSIHFEHCHTHRHVVVLVESGCHVFGSYVVAPGAVSDFSDAVHATPCRTSLSR